MSDEINIRITMDAYDKLKLIKKWYDIYYNTNTSKKFLVEYTLDQFMMEKKIIKHDIPWVTQIINSAGHGYRFDRNFNIITKDALNTIKKKKKLKNITQVIDIISKYYIDNDPEMKEIKEELEEIYLNGV